MSDIDSGLDSPTTQRSASPYAVRASAAGANGEGPHLGVVLTGYLTKRGRVTGQTKRRYYALTEQHLHTFIRGTQNELFGEVRQRIPLRDVVLGSIQRSAERQCAFEFTSVSGKQWVLVADTQADCEAWVDALLRTATLLQTGDPTRTRSRTITGNYSTALAGVYTVLPQERGRPPRVHTVSIRQAPVGGQAGAEYVVARDIEVGTRIQLGALPPGSVVSVTLANGDWVGCSPPVEGDTLSRAVRTSNSFLDTLSQMHIVWERESAANQVAPAVPGAGSGGGVGVGAGGASPEAGASKGKGRDASFTRFLVSAWLPTASLLLATMYCMYEAPAVTPLLLVTWIASLLLSFSVVAPKWTAYRARDADGPRLSSTASIADGRAFYWSLTVRSYQPLVMDPSAGSSSSRVEYGSDQDSEPLVDPGAGVGVGAGSAADAGRDEMSELMENEAFQRYIRGCRGDVTEAKRRWDLSVAWRAENNVDEILEQPHRSMRLIKVAYPHFFHGRGREGHLIYIEKPGGIDLKRLRAAGIDVEALVWHYLYITEFLWKHLEPTETGKTITILDVKGIGLRDVGGDVMDFIKKASAFIQAHYLERSFKIFIVNAPSWFSMVWKLVSPLLDEATRKKTHILGSSFQAQLLEHIDPDQLPPDYGGTCACGADCRYDSAFERRLVGHCDRVNKATGTEIHDDGQGIDGPNGQVPDGDGGDGGGNGDGDGNGNGK